MEPSGSTHIRKAETRTQFVERTLGRDIVEGVLHPGSPLKIETLRSLYGVGGSPIREALTRLTGKGLVKLESNKGFRVAEFSVADLEDIAFIRTAIETHAIQRALVNGGPDWEAGIVAALHKLVVLTERVDTDLKSLDRWQIAHDDFHFALISACESERVIAQQKTLAEQQSRYRRVLMGSNFPRDLLISEHQGLAEAALDRDHERICNVLDAHFKMTYAFYRDVLEDVLVNT